MIPKPPKRQRQPPIVPRVQFPQYCLILLLFLPESSSLHNATASKPRLTRQLNDNVFLQQSFPAEEEADELPSISDNAFVQQFDTEEEAAAAAAEDLPSISQSELDLCWNTLNRVSINEGTTMGRGEYVIFLEIFSSRSLRFNTFDDLPLSLVLVFFTAACSRGQRCSSTINPQVELKDLDYTPLLTLFCTTVKDLAAVQIEFIFQYRVRYYDGYSAEQIVRGSLGTTVKTHLEEATELVLLDRFGCDDASTQRRTREEVVASELQRRRDDEDQSIWDLRSILGGSSTEKYVSRQQQPTRDLLLQGGLRRRDPELLQGDVDERGLQRIGLPSCDYRVSATVLDMVNIGECSSQPEVQQYDSFHL
jgi:hypothetical protein